MSDVRINLFNRLRPHLPEIERALGRRLATLTDPQPALNALEVVASAEREATALEQGDLPPPVQLDGGEREYLGGLIRVSWIDGMHWSIGLHLGPIAIILFAARDAESEGIGASVNTGAEVSDEGAMAHAEVELVGFALGLVLQVGGEEVNRG